MEWYPTPSYLVKRRVILDFLENCPVTNFLEVGCGCGDLLHTLERRGYYGTGIDISQAALAVAGAGLSTARIKVKCCSPEEIQEKFDIVIASEVMEHYQDDISFLLKLRDRLNGGGHLILTVPAHMNDWGANDDVCGHFRRYERNELFRTLMENGFENITIFSYGVPIYNIMKPFYDLAVRKQSSASNTHMEKTAESAGMKLLGQGGNLFRLLFNDVTMFPLYLLQRLFYRTDRGKGYFVAAQKRS